MEIDAVKSGPTFAILCVRVQPRASHDGLALQPDGTLKVRLTAAPVEGEANRALLQYLARTFAVPKSSLQIVAGKSGRTKRVRILGADAAWLQAKLSTLPTDVP